jgi:hypothetical protein
MHSVIQILVVAFLIAGIATHGYSRSFSECKIRNWLISALVVTLFICTKIHFDDDVKNMTDEQYEQYIQQLEPPDNEWDL